MPILRDPDLHVAAIVLISLVKSQADKKSRNHAHWARAEAQSSHEVYSTGECRQLKLDGRIRGNILYAMYYQALENQEMAA